MRRLPLALAQPSRVARMRKKPARQRRPIHLWGNLSMWTGPRFITDGDGPVAQAALLRAAAAKLDITDPVVVGHSFGGIVSLAWAVAGLDTQSPQNASAIVSLAGVALPWPDDLDAYYRVNGSALGGGLIIPVRT